MKLVCRAVLLAAATALFAVASVSAAPAKLSGTVHDENGGPVAGAKLTVTSSNSKDVNESATTDESGGFSVDVPNARWSYTFRVEHDGFSPSQVDVPTATTTIPI